MDRLKSIFAYALTFIVGLITLTLSLENFTFILALILTFLASFITYYLLKKFFLTGNAGDGQKPLPKLSKDKKDFYQSKGLSSDDITFFRQTMMTTKEHIIAIEKQLKSSSRLRAIEKRNNTIEICKAMFKDIVQEPDRLHQVDQFLYIHLPSLNEISQKHQRIEAHKAKSKVTYDILRKSADTIDDLCQQITQDYLSFKDDDLSEIEVSIDITEQTIERNNTTRSDLDENEI